MLNLAQKVEPGAHGDKNAYVSASLGDLSAFRLTNINNGEGGLSDSRIGHQRGDKASNTFTQYYPGSRDEELARNCSD